MNYYNEHDPYAAAWLRNLISAGLIPAGEVDERSIEDVRPVELRGFTQCQLLARKYWSGMTPESVEELVRMEMGK